MLQNPPRAADSKLWFLSFAWWNKKLRCIISPRLLSDSYQALRSLQIHKKDKKWHIYPLFWLLLPNWMFRVPSGIKLIRHKQPWQTVTLRLTSGPVCVPLLARGWNMISREQKPFRGFFIFRRNVGLQRAAAWHWETALWNRVRFQPHHIPNWSLWLSKCLPLSVFSTLSVFSQFLSAEAHMNPGISPRNLGDLRVNLGAEITETAEMWWCCQLLQYCGDKKKKKCLDGGMDTWGFQTKGLPGKSADFFSRGKPEWRELQLPLAHVCPSCIGLRSLSWEVSLCHEMRKWENIADRQ